MERLAKLKLSVHCFNTADARRENGESPLSPEVFLSQKMPFKPVNECNRLIYKRGCQEHSCPSTGSGESLLDFQPLSAMRGVRFCFFAL